LLISNVTTERVALEEEAAICSKHDFEFISLPVPDLGVPHDTEAFVATVDRLARLVRDGSNIAVHCRQSVGRSGLLAVSLVVALGMTIQRISSVLCVLRGGELSPRPHHGLGADGRN